MTTTIKFTPVDVASRKKLDIKPGYIVRVSSKIEEKGKTRLQAFEGMVLARKHGTESGATFTVRKVASGVGVERIFPLYSPLIDKIEVVRRNKARRAKLYYVRDKAAKEIRKKMKTLAFDERAGEEEVVEAPVEEEVKTEEAVEVVTEEAPTDEVSAEETPAEAEDK